MDDQLLPRDALHPPLTEAGEALLGVLHQAQSIDRDPDLDTVNKESRLRSLEEAFNGWAPPDGLEKPVAALRDYTAANGIAAHHVRHLLQARIKVAGGFHCRSWSDLLVFCSFAAAPIGRFLLEAAGEDTPVARPALEALFTARLILFFVRDCKRDYGERDRLFLPEDWFKEASISPDRLTSSAAVGQTRAVLDRVLDATDHLLREAVPLPTLIEDRGLRQTAAEILYRTQMLSMALKRRDPLAGAVEPGWWEKTIWRLKSYLIGLLK